MVVRSNALFIYGEDFKVITCCYTESSEGVGPVCDCGHSRSIPPHFKPSGSISVIDPIWCRVTPGESDGGGSAVCNTKTLWWSSGNWERIDRWSMWKVYKVRIFSSKAIGYTRCFIKCFNSIYKTHSNLTIRSCGEVTADGCALHAIQYCKHL